MGTRVESRSAAGSGGFGELPFVIYANIIWYLVVIYGSVSAGLSLFNGVEVWDEEIGLGRFVQRFIAGVAFLPAVLAVLAIIFLLQKKPVGRYIALVINFLGAVMLAAWLLQLWGVFVGFDSIARAMYENSRYVWGIALAYAVYWIAGRLDERNIWQGRIEMVAVGIGMLALIAFLWDAEFLKAINSILSKYDSLQIWLVTIAIIIFTVLFFGMLNLGRYFGERPEQQAAWQGWLMLAPNIVGFMLFFAGPLLLSFYLSFTNDSVGNVPEFLGLKNYGEILGLQVKSIGEEVTNPQEVLSRGYSVLTSINIGSRRLIIGASDSLFWRSMGNTIVFCAMLVPLSVIPALFLSIILNSKIPGMKVFRAIYFLPSVAAVVGTALIWRWLYDPTIGFFNYFISQIVTFLNNIGFNVSDPAIQWLTGTGTMLISIVFLAAWQVVGFNTVLFLAGLQGIPKELYEAAYVDGANRWQQFLNITVPMLGPTTFFVTITTIITGLQAFNEPYALIFQRPMPIEARTAVFHLYDIGFSRFQFGYASSVAWILFAVIFTITLLQFRFSRSKAYQD